MSRRPRLAVRLGLDGNSLRWRTDKIAAYGAAGPLVVFLVQVADAGAGRCDRVAARWHAQPHRPVRHARLQGVPGW